MLELREPLPPFDTRYEGKLEAILGSVSQTYADEYLNPTVLDAASAYFNTFIRSQSFKNGNKRLGVLYTHFFLLANNVDLTLTPDELFNFAAFIAQAGEKGFSMDQTKVLCQEIIEKYSKDC